MPTENSTATFLSLDQLRPGQGGRIVRLSGDARISFRLMEMGLFAGEDVEFLGCAPLGDPIAVMIRGCRLALRRRDAALVDVALKQV